LVVQTRKREEEEEEEEVRFYIGLMGKLHQAISLVVNGNWWLI
jgi:hypothetical protein